MEFQVNTNNVILAQINQVESGEYNVTECRFIFSSEYEGLTKIAVFTGANGDAYKITILNNKCEIPSELLTESQIVQIGVYAYEVQGTEFVLRYSPMPTRFMIEKGSYVVNAVNMSRPTPTEVEQLQFQITHNANDIEDLQQTVSEHTTDISNIQSDINDIKAEQTEQNTNIQKNTDDIVNINQAMDTINTDITDIDSAIGDINEDIDNLEQDLTNYSLITETGSQINLNVNSTNYKITAILKDKNGNVIYTSNAIDLPIESMIVNARYDNQTKEIVLTLQNGNTLRISVADLVSGLVSETQLQTILANYYTKTEVDNLLSALAERVSTNEEDIAGIKEEQTTQNTNIEELQNQVETLQEDLESANSEIEELNTDLSNMRKAMLQVEGQGTDITLENTSENKFIELGLNGNTEQEQLTGKNLFDKNIEPASKWQLTSEVYNNGIELKSTANSGVCYAKYVFQIFSSNDMYFSFSKTGTGKINVYLRDGEGNELNSYVNKENSFIINNISSEAKKIDIRFYGSTANTGDVTIFDNIQLELGSTATSFEPYCGGIPSPNPDFPQQIKNVTGNANVKIQNKNLAITNFPDNISLKGSGNNRTVVASSYKLSQIIKVKPNTTYSINGDYSSISDQRMRIYYFDEYPDINAVSTKYIYSEPSTAYTFTTDATTQYILLFGVVSPLADVVIPNLQLEQGSTATSYVEHQEQNLPFTLGNIELCKIGDCQDYFYKENGKWYKHQEIGKVIYDGSNDENWALDNVNVGQFSIFVSGVTNAPIYSNFFGYKLTYSATGKPYIRPVQNKFYLELGTEMLPEVSVSALRAWLSTHNTEIYYILETPTNTEITDTTLINQLEAILQARSYDDITIISSESDELGFNMKVVAVADANKVINSFDTRLLALESEV